MTRTRPWLALLFALVALIGSSLTFAGQPATAAAGRAYTNPVKSQKGADPWLEYYNGNYYLVTTSWSSEITMRKSPTLAGLATAPSVQIFKDTNPNRCCNIWAPEIHLLNGKWYLYYVAGQGIADYNSTQRMHVAESAGTDPMGPYTFKNDLGAPGNDTWLIDGSVLKVGSALYLLGSAFSGGTQNLVIAPMSNPYTVSGALSVISTPTYSWEKSGAAVNEGPEPLYHDGKTFIVYSGSYCTTPDYKLGQLELTGSNPLLASSWTKRSTPVFQRNDAAGVYGPGHNGFFKSPDGTEDWIVYHANNSASGGCDNNRTTRAQKFTWNADGTPNFGVPVGAGVTLSGPSGETAATPTSYSLVNRNSGKCLDLVDGSSADGANVRQFTCNGAAAQKWRVEDQADDTSRLVNVASGKVLDLADCSGADGADLRQWSWLNNSCQRFRLVISDSGGWVRLVNASSGKVADVANCGTADGADVRQWTWLNNACQQWQLTAN
ncbi:MULTISPECIES: family 43 glycosylhydrolase [unclassified Kitasatospora]|uniref:family 43 glycosylhydrolase n=1 Tax=unclassified Kitasatospora TaxID=2633591 RepID=UPI00070C9E04|nr:MULTISPECIES: family 43 glycosylhydrolase [unclassified Kitasatospora]KQV13915.1 hydrolase [Kitasatospora sp. Root107]KRB68962.1 hydrolase [Kitasatospora sp. Root187]